MLKIVSDVDIEGHFNALIALIQSHEMAEIWHDLDVEVLTFDDLGLDNNATDRVVWNAIQARTVIMITGNRNREHEDSLQATLEDSNTAESLPVITISDVQRFRADRHFAERAAVKLVEFLFDIDQHRGAGRLYIP